MNGICDIVLQMFTNNSIDGEIVKKLCTCVIGLTTNLNDEPHILNTTKFSSKEACDIYTSTLERMCLDSLALKSISYMISSVFSIQPDKISNFTDSNMLHILQSIITSKANTSSLKSILLIIYVFTTNEKMKILCRQEKWDKILLNCENDAPNKTLKHIARITLERLNN
jgi:hypothetical protein